MVGKLLIYLMFVFIDQNSSLEFKLHRLQFIGLIQEGASRQNEAIQYARTHLSQFVRRHEKGKYISSLS